mmetsp:Transcript_17268/g.38771  ORF Transcript_17268/g.38771 Transcript_17268/m.38771 type:complete len:90 (-) Transcript_17268:25-294(-)
MQEACRRYAEGMQGHAGGMQVLLQSWRVRGVTIELRARCCVLDAAVVCLKRTGQSSRWPPVHLAADAHMAATPTSRLRRVGIRVGISLR